MEYTISVENLVVEYQKEDERNEAHRAVNNLSFNVERGQVFGFLGPNGAGKTSTMKVLLGFLPPTTGRASLFGEDVSNPAARMRIGYLPELTYYYKFLTVEELLRFYATIFGIDKKETEKRIDEILRLVELDHVRKKQIKGYSKGMQQRAGLAQALLNDPELLILDEPTSGLDPLGRQKVRNIIRRLKDQGKTVFFSSHELGEVEATCDQVAILNKGRLQETGGVEDLMKRYGMTMENLFLHIIESDQSTTSPA